ncbi:MAG: hypothetical protein LBT34_03665 [Clostridiales Family XIII bacterium]|jgi:uncharacterized membrane protein YcgQ (UPF0703/DUF1980 family)|nr:hypothetical protein [Clostridiales Family XIII bacterium]
MKKICALITASLVLSAMLTGCSNKPSANLPPKNNNGTQTVNLLNSTNSGVISSESDSVGIPSPEHGDGSAIDSEVSVAASGDVVEIKEKLFIAQTNDIYYNAEDYLGKIIKYEGIFDVYEVPETGLKYYSVIRYGPGCCGIDANAGFEVTCSGAYPNANDWVEAIGVLESYEEDGYQYLRLNLSSLNVLPARGAEYVSQ